MPIRKVSSSMQFSRRWSSGEKRSSASETYWVPNTDVYMTNDCLVIKVELAGIQRDELELTAEGNKLRIHGFRKDGCRKGKCQFQIMEINYGPFETTIEIPPNYELNKAQAMYHNGFLRVDVPLKNEGENGPRSIPVSDQDE
ncbi:MAG: Hsp20/alpha crystallin family protein [Verrucomicrobia bacterium]|nr:Hsp20/alpha crystallin family protein [Verrucomicrobiota bacterium]MCF7707360.1 Hsp20/alpha crystallin family protein [Verrucomicrobiota bacterium]